jgi:hypothetical protein
MHRFQAGKHWQGAKHAAFRRPNWGSAASGYPWIYWDAESHIRISRDRLAYTDIEKDIS